MQRQSRASQIVQTKECTLKNTLEALRISEQTQEQLKQIAMYQEGSASVNAVQKGATRKQEKRKDKVHPELALCKYYGGKHLPDRSKCQANGKNYHRCGKPNHFQTVCRLRKNTDRSTNIPVTADVEGVESSSDSDRRVSV